VYEFERSSASKLLESLEERMAITADMWTSRNHKRGHMAMTTHYIDEIGLCIVRFRGNDNFF
jgi:hypothetical protein